jgi:protein gp37
MTAIEWTASDDGTPGETWNPVTGCRKVSPGCQHCDAETVARRGMGPWKGRRFEDVRTHDDRLDAPLRWRKPRRVFVNSMSDLFHEDVPDDFLDRVFAVMALAEQHQFIVLTKRPERMCSYLTDALLSGWDRSDKVNMRAHDIDPERAFGQIPARGDSWPLRNVILGVSCEDQKRADERIEILRYTPAACRAVSAEPLLAPIDFGAWLAAPEPSGTTSGGVQEMIAGAPLIDWIIIGGESGPRARPCDMDWVRDIRDQCRAAGVACFTKQLGAHVIARYRGEPLRVFLNNSKGGDMNEWPNDLRIREWPPMERA